MPNFHRYYIPQSIVFITSVTHQRTPYLGSIEHLDLFWKVVRREQKVQSFRLLAYIILPDHFHWLMQMPAPQPNFSLPIGRIKRNFTIAIKQLHGEMVTLQVWQERFWDHVIRNEDDLERHIDYIH